MGDSPKPTQAEFDELKAEVTELREQVSVIQGALNALVVVYSIPRIPTPGDD